MEDCIFCKIIAGEFGTEFVHENEYAVVFKDINPKAESFIGDYLATSIDEYCLYASKEMKTVDLFKGHHAGNTKEEMLIDISVFNC